MTCSALGDDSTYTIAGGGGRLALILGAVAHSAVRRASAIRRKCWGKSLVAFSGDWSQRGSAVWEQTDSATISATRLGIGGQRAARAVALSAVQVKLIAAGKTKGLKALVQAMEAIRAATARKSRGRSDAIDALRAALRLKSTFTIGRSCRQNRFVLSSCVAAPQRGAKAIRGRSGGDRLILRRGTNSQSCAAAV